MHFTHKCEVTLTYENDFYRIEKLKSKNNMIISIDEDENIWQNSTFIHDLKRKTQKTLSKQIKRELPEPHNGHLWKTYN